MKQTKRALSALMALLLCLMMLSVAVVAEGGTHTVTFRIMTEKYEGIPYAYKELTTVTVNDGELVTPPDKSEIPAVPYNIHYEMTFDELGKTSGSYAGWNKDLSQPVTEDMVVDAVYKMNPKVYTVTYHDYDGRVLGSGDEVFDHELQNAPTGLTRPSDLTYVYDFQDEWETAYARTKKTGEVFSSDALFFSEESPDAIDVYAVYHTRLQRYPVTICVIDDDGEPADGAIIQISTGDKTLAEGDKVYGTTDENGFCNLEVNYSVTGYVISATWPQDDSKAKVINKDAAEIVNLDDVIVMQLVNSSQYNADNKPRCTHICHSFIGGLYITGLNLLYRIFHVKYVCCYDMYATHGDRLAYTAD